MSGLQTTEEIIKIQPRGTITIPKKMRAGGFEQNSHVRITKSEGRIVIEPATVLPYPIRTYTDSEVDEFIKMDKEATKRLKKAGIL